MTVEIALTLAVLVAAIVLFISERVRVDLTALLVLGSLALSGLVTPAEALSGFSNPAVVTVWAVFILSAGLSRTGVANAVGRQVLRLAGTGEVRLLVVIMLAAGIMSAFMNNVGVTALLLPVVMDIARRTGRAPSRLLMPLAFGALLGGLTTLIGTPPNILASDALRDAGLAPFSLFDFLPVGGAIMLAGVAFMALVGRHLLPERAKTSADGVANGNRAQLGDVYGLGQRLSLIRLPERTPLAGKTLAESRIGTALGLTVVGVIRKGQTELAPRPEMQLRGGDRLLVTGAVEQLAKLREWEYLVLENASVGLEDLTSSEIDLVEVTLPPDSAFLSQTLKQIDFRGRFGVNVLALWGHGHLQRTDLQDVPLRAAMTLLVQGTRAQIQALQASPALTVRASDTPRTAGIYRLHERLLALQIPPDSSLVGQTLRESRFGDAFDLTVLGIMRGGETELMPPPDARLEAGDTLLVEARREDLSTLRGLQSLEVENRLRPAWSELESAAIGMVEAVLSPHTTLVGKTLNELHFREKYQLNVVAIWREGRAYRTQLRDMALRFGDALLLYGPRSKLALLAHDPDFLVLEEALQEALRLERAPVAAVIMLGVVLSVMVGWLPIAIAAVVGATLMVLSGCLKMDEAYRRIQWNAVFLIAGMLPLGIAMENSGAASFLAEGVINRVGALGPLYLIGALFLLTTLASQVMPNAVVTVLLAPIALSAAGDLGFSPYALMMVVAIAASASFISPVGHPANVLIMGRGGYRFGDYVRVGLPLTLVVLVVTLLLLPLVWPLS